jgi:tubulin monoglycylase TTLL3/8
MDDGNQFPNGPFVDKIVPQLKKGVISSLLATRESCFQQNNITHEMFGYDFMVDTSLNVWLIEVNSSPSMEYSSPITEKMVKEVLPNVSDLAVSLLEGTEFKVGDTNGKFEMIFSA